MVILMDPLEAEAVVQVERWLIDRRLVSVGAAQGLGAS